MSPIRAAKSLIDRNSNALLVVVCLAQFMVILDVSIVNVALPSIRSDLGFSTTGLQWVVNAYTLTFAGFLMLGGRAADLLGRRQVFLAGTALFAFASLACAVADSQPLLLGARALQGIGAAVISPASLAIITTSFAQGRERNRALGFWGAMAGLGGTSGVIFGGLLTQSLGWPAIFLINVPIGIAVIVYGRGLVPASRETRPDRNFDASGAVLVTAGLTAFVFGIVRTDTLGWGSPGVLIPLAISALLLGAFALVEGRIARDPLIPLRVFRMPILRSANLVIALLYSGFFAIWFFLSLFLQRIHGYDALQTGVSFLPMTLTIVATSSLAPRLVNRFGARAVLTTGMLLAAIGLVLLSGLSSTDGYLLHVLPGGVIAAAGLGFSLVPATILAVQGVPPSESGLASGMLNTSRLFGGAIGLAALSTIAASHTNSQIAAGTSAVAATAQGYQVAFGVGAALCFLGAALAAILLRERNPAPAGALSSSA